MILRHSERSEPQKRDLKPVQPPKVAVLQRLVRDNFFGINMLKPILFLIALYVFWRFTARFYADNEWALWYSGRARYAVAMLLISSVNWFLFFSFIMTLLNYFGFALSDLVAFLKGCR